MNTEQSQLPGLYPIGEPVACSGADLSRVIQEARHLGLYPIRTDVRGSSYLLTFARDPKPDCQCDICASLTAPSDQVASELRQPDAGQPDEPEAHT